VGRQERPPLLRAPGGADRGPAATRRDRGEHAGNRADAQGQVHHGDRLGWQHRLGDGAPDCLLRAEPDGAHRRS